MIRKITLITIILTLLCTKASSEFVWQNLTAPFHGVAMVDKDNYYICGGDGKLIYTVDGGLRYNSIETGSYLNFYDIKLYKDSVMAIAADSGTVLVSYNKGKKWIKNCIDKLQIFKEINILDSKTFVVSSVLGNIYKSTDSGANWEKIYSLENGEIVTIKFFASGTGYALVNLPDSSGYLAKTTNGGSKWEKTFITKEIFEFSNMDFYNESNGMIVGHNIDTLDEKYHITRIYKTTDGCMVWDSILIKKGDGGGNKSAAKYLNDSTVIFLNRVMYLKTTDNGLNWTADSINGREIFFQNPGFTNYIFHDNADCDEKGFVITVGGRYNQFITKSFDNFNSYKVEKFFPIDISNDNVADPLDIINISKDRYIFTTDYGRIMESLDGGNTWNWFYPKSEAHNDQETPYWMYRNKGFPVIHFNKQKNTGFILSSKSAYDDRHALYTDDGFKNLTTKNNVALEWNSNFAAINDSTFIAVFEDEFQKTTDGGKYWSSKKISKNWKEGSHGIFYTQGLLYLLYMKIYDSKDSVDGIPVPRLEYMVWKSTDLGETFDTVFYDDNEFEKQYSSIYFTDRDNGMLFGLDSVIKRTTDGGITWFDQPFEFYKRIGDLGFYNDTVAVASGFRDTLFYSTDKGYTWTMHILPFQPLSSNNASRNSASKIKKLDDGYIYVLRGTRLLRGKWVEPAPVKVEDNESIEDNTKPWFYITTKPNPAFNSMRVKLWGLNSVNGKEFSVKVFNIQGEEVKDITQLALGGSNGYTSEFSVSLNDLQKGVYFLRIISNGYSKTHKFVKE